MHSTWQVIYAHPLILPLQGREAMEWVIDTINTEMKDLATSAKKSMEEISTSMDNINIADKINIDNIKIADKINIDNIQLGVKFE